MLLNLKDCRSFDEVRYRYIARNIARFVCQLYCFLFSILTDRGYTYSEEFRMLCEARHVCGMRSIHDQREYLKGVQEKRGVAACNQLKQKMAEVWGSRSVA